MASIKVYTIPSELKSAKRLAMNATVELDEFTCNYNKDVIVRWGNSQLHYHDNSYKHYGDFKKVINPSLAICRNCDKGRTSQILSEIVPTPTVFKGSVPKGKLAVVRPLNHSGGSHFKVVKGPFKIPSGYYAKEFIKTDDEMRVWFAGEKTFGGMRRNVFNDPVGEFPCRSKWGYEYWNVPDKMHSNVLKAAKAIGLELGAADIIIKGNRHYFLELNSAPTVDTYTIERFYRREIPAIIKKKFGLDFPIKIN